jgi:UDP-3-O-[3-hydroxymyristoyl] glucosamine N-acyltransferase
VVEDGASLGDSVSIGPGCVVRAGAKLGDRTVLTANVYVGEDAQIGDDCYFHPGVVIYHGVRIGNGCAIHANSVLGSDGFGYVWDGSQHAKVPQVGTVEVGDQVEIGANTCVDRAAYRATTIGSGTIIDNLVQIGHNCEIGRCVVLCGGVGLGGSTKIGDGSIWGGAAMSAGHVEVGAGATVIGASTVVSDIPAGETVAGKPAWNYRLELRRVSETQKLATGNRTQSKRERKPSKD